LSRLIGNRKRNVEDARIAIDSYFDAIQYMAEQHAHLQFAIRALDLSVLISDGDRTDRARTVLMDVHRKLMKTSVGMWWHTVDRLLGDKKAGVTDVERAELVADLESIVTNGSHTGDAAHFNPHEAKDAAERLIRKYGLSTSVGKRSIAAIRRFDIEPGRCYSACAYAYLGGQFRYLTKGSRYGVHQFASTGSGSEGRAQVASAIIVEYIRSMDVDTELFSLSVSAGRGAMNEVDTQTMERLNVINNGKTRAVWSIESGGGQLYLKGERITEISGINKFMLICGADRKLGLYVIFDALGRDDELMKMSAPSLQIDKQVYRLDAVSKSIRNGWFNGIYNLSIREIEGLRNAQRVGVTLQFSYDAPVFLGFQDMPIGGGRERLLGFINQCR
jgi:hypothetical protein